MKRTEISPHEVRICKALKDNPSKWLSNKDVADMANVSERTARMHTLRLAKMGVLEVAPVFPSHRYQWSKNEDRKTSAYLRSIENAAKVFEASLTAA